MTDTSWRLPPRAHIEILRLTASKIEFRLTGADAALAVALHRVLTSEVPTLALHEMVRERNSTVFRDDDLARRLGWLAIVSAPHVDRLQFKENCRGVGVPCESGHCANCAIQVELSVALPPFALPPPTPLAPVEPDDGEHKDTTKPPPPPPAEPPPLSLLPESARVVATERIERFVMTRDIVAVDYSATLDPPLQYATLQPSAAGADEGFVTESMAKRERERGAFVIRMIEGQEVKVRLWVRKGTAAQHGHDKWSAALSRFWPEAQIDVDEDLLLSTPLLDAEQREQWGRSCPVGAFRWNAARGGVDVVDAAACYYCGECELVAEDIGLPTTTLDGAPVERPLIRVAERPGTYRFVVESQGQYEPLELLSRALDVLRAKLQAIADFADDALNGRTRQRD